MPEETKRWLQQHDRRLDGVEGDVATLGKEVREDIRELRGLVNRRFDGVDQAHQDAQKINFKSLAATALAVAAAIGVPMATAVIVAPK